MEVVRRTLDESDGAYGISFRAMLQLPLLKAVLFSTSLAAGAAAWVMYALFLMDRSFLVFWGLSLGASLVAVVGAGFVSPWHGPLLAFLAVMASVLAYRNWGRRETGVK